jgi:hypothetical protein
MLAKKSLAIRQKYYNEDKNRVAKIVLPIILIPSLIIFAILIRYKI